MFRFYASRQVQYNRRRPGRDAAEGSARDQHRDPQHCLGASANRAGQFLGGALATASGLVFFGEDSGALMAVDATNGKPLRQFQTNQTWKASPMTYMFDGKQYIAVAAGSNIISFALLQ